MHSLHVTGLHAEFSTLQAKPKPTSSAAKRDKLITAPREKHSLPLLCSNQPNAKSQFILSHSHWTGEGFLLTQYFGQVLLAGLMVVQMRGLIFYPPWGVKQNPNLSESNSLFRDQTQLSLILLLPSSHCSLFSLLAANQAPTAATSTFSRGSSISQQTILGTTLTPPPSVLVRSPSRDGSAIFGGVLTQVMLCAMLILTINTC